MIFIQEWVVDGTGTIFHSCALKWLDIYPNENFVYESECAMAQKS